MNMKPILFSTEMVQAILAGRKTQTRRIVKPQPTKNEFGNWDFKFNGHSGMNIDDAEKSFNEPFAGILEHCKYQPNDILWVRETWSAGGNFTSGPGYIYKADFEGKISTAGFKWRPSIFMPKEACRLFLKIKSIRVDRLQDIDPHDALNEGVEYWNINKDALEGGELMADFKNYNWRDDEKYENYHFPTFANSVDSFRSLWQSINGIESWEANPWIWVIEFEQCEKPLV